VLRLWRVIREFWTPESPKSGVRLRTFSEIPPSSLRLPPIKSPDILEYVRAAEQARAQSEGNNDESSSNSG
jgi:hypothetical protein